MPTLDIPVCSECEDEDDTNVRWCRIIDADTGYEDDCWLCRFCFGEIAGTEKLDSRNWYDKPDYWTGKSWRLSGEMAAELWDLGALPEGHPFADAA